jgi:hypothetical protein
LPSPEQISISGPPLFILPRMLDSRMEPLWLLR